MKFFKKYISCACFLDSTTWQKAKVMLWIRIKVPVRECKQEIHVTSHSFSFLSIMFFQWKTNFIAESETNRETNSSLVFGHMYSRYVDILQMFNIFCQQY